MICEKCGTENNELARFCKKCGSPLNTFGATTVKAINSTASRIYKNKDDYVDLKKELEELKVVFDIRVEEMKSMHKDIESIKRNVNSLTKRQAEIENQQKFMREEIKKRIEDFERNVKNSFDFLSAKITDLSKNELKKIRSESKRIMEEKVNELINTEISEMKSAFKKKTVEMERLIDASLRDYYDDIEAFKRKIRRSLDRSVRKLNVLDDCSKRLEFMETQIVKNKRQLDGLTKIINSRDLEKEIELLKERESEIETKQDFLEKRLEKECEKIKKEVENYLDYISKSVKDLAKADLTKIKNEIETKINERISNELDPKIVKIDSFIKEWAKKSAEIKEIEGRVKLLSDDLKKLPTQKDVEDVVAEVMKSVENLPKFKEIDISLSEVKKSIVNTNAKINAIENRIEKLSRIAENNEICEKLKAEILSIKTRLNSFERTLDSISRQSPSKFENMKNEILAEIKTFTEQMVNERLNKVNTTPIESGEKTLEVTKPRIDLSIDYAHDKEVESKENRGLNVETKVDITDGDTKQHPTPLKKIKSRILEKRKTSEDSSIAKNEEDKANHKESEESNIGKFTCRYCHQPFSSRTILEMHELICNERPENKNNFESENH